MPGDAMTDRLGDERDDGDVAQTGGAERRLHSTFNVQARQCEICGYELKIAAYLNGQIKCGRCYGIEKGYYSESADPCFQAGTDQEGQTDDE